MRILVVGATGGLGRDVVAKALAGGHETAALGAALVFPGRAYRVLMALLPFVPRRLERRRAAKTGERLRSGGSDS